MMQNRLNKSNPLLEILVRKLHNGFLKRMPITVNVNGQLITGIAVRSSYFTTSETTRSIKESIIDEVETEVDYFVETGIQIEPELPYESPKDLPDFLCQHMLYLKDAYYLPKHKGLMPSKKIMQIRVSDISSFYIGYLQLTEKS